MQKKKYMKRMLVMATLGVTMALGTVGMTAEAAAQTDKAQTNVQTQQAAADTKVQGESNLKLTPEWDKVFPESRDVNHRKVTFHNRYGIELAADLYEPKKLQANSRPLRSADLSARLRNSLQGFMHRNWRNAVS